MKNFFSSFFKKENPYSKPTSIVLVLILIVIAVISFYPSAKKNIGKENAITVAEDFINEYLMAPGSKASVLEVTDEYGLYKLEVDIVNGVVESYLSKDGKLFFPQALNIEEINQEKAPESSAPMTEVSNKSDKPVVELFVMSHCPFGTQIEKGILPVVKALGNNIDFQLKFNSYAMHGEIEIVEQINQYCIIEEQSTVFYNYLECFLIAGDSKTCLASANVDENKLKTCFNKVERDYNIIADFENKNNYQGNYPSFNLQKQDNEKYNVGGSPTLVINGETVRPNRDSASLLYTICTAFNTQPDECFLSMPSASPAPGFGTGTTDSNVSVNCE